MKYKIVLSLAAVLMTTSAIAQHRHEFSIWGQGGLSTLKYKTTFGKQKDGFGGAAGLGYTFFFSEHWGIGTGGEISLYNASTKVNGLTDGYKIIDRDNQPADYYMSFDRYKEKQSLWTVNIPLFLQYQTGGNTQFYATLGGKVAFPLKEKYKSTNSQITAWAYYPMWDQTLYDPREEGYGTFQNGKIDGDLEFKIAYLASAEAGVKWRLHDNWSLYTGVYVDYGINNIKKRASDKQFMQYNPLSPTDFKSNGLFESSYTRNGRTDKFTDKVNLMSAGLKIKLAFGGGKTSRPAIIDVPFVETRPVVPAIDEAAEARRRAEDQARREAEEARRIAEEAARKAREAELAALQKAKLDIAFTLDHFQLGKSMLTSDIRAIVDARIDILRTHPELKIMITGHTCNIDSHKKNLEVGLRRANEVKAYMVDKGIAEDRIVAATKAETEPVVPNTSNANRLKNRRVEVVAHE